MSLPPVPETPDELDDRYRRMSELDASRPGETVRRRVLEHAAQLAAQRAGRPASATRAPSGRRQWPSLRWRPAAVFGTLAVAAIAGLMIAPRFLVSPVTPRSRLLSAPPVATELRENKAAGGSLASRTRAPEPAPARQPVPFPHEELAAASPPVAAVGPPSALPARPAAGARVPHPVASRDAADLQVAVTGAPATNVTDAAAALRHAAETGDLHAVDRLLATQSDINARDAAGRTPLMLAVLRGQTDTVSALLAYGADPNAADSHGTTPLQAARAAGRPAIVAALQRYGAR